MKWMTKTVRIEDIDGMQYEMMDLIYVSNEIQETIGRNYHVPYYIDEEVLSQLVFPAVGNFPAPSSVW